MDLVTISTVEMEPYYIEITICRPKDCTEDNFQVKRIMWRQRKLLLLERSWADGPGRFAGKQGKIPLFKIAYLL